MQLTIDNLDGNGPVDYTAATVATGPLTIVRKRGEMTTCRALLDVVGSGLAAPAAQGFVTVTGDAGAILFRGFVTRAVPAGALWRRRARCRRCTWRQPIPRGCCTTRHLASLQPAAA